MNALSSLEDYLDDQTWWKKWGDTDHHKGSAEPASCLAVLDVPVVLG
jgi:hypothetical protein